MKMAINVSSLALPSSFTALGARNFTFSSPPMAAPLLPVTVNSRRVFMKSGVPSITMVGDTGEEIEKEGNSLIKDQVTTVVRKVGERDFANTPYVPVYVKLPPGAINMDCELVDPDDLINQLKILKAINVDGVTVDCWWGIVEAHTPQQYNWSGYRKLFHIVRDLQLKLRVVMCFHECGGNNDDDVHIPLPQWVIEVGRDNPDIFFTDREGRRNHECLTWGIDNEYVLRCRSADQVYWHYMRSFCNEFYEFLEHRVISEVEIGLGPCGELRYPSHPPKHGWKYPGIGEFQCYDKYLTKSLVEAAQAHGCSSWGRVPDNAGSYNSKPYETKFFSYAGDFNMPFYGRFFLNWYSKVLIDHGDRVLGLARLTFKGTPLAAKLPSIYWWYNTNSHAPELTAGIYQHHYHQGYGSIASMLKEHGTTLNFKGVELRKDIGFRPCLDFSRPEDFPEAIANPERASWEVLNTSWDVGIRVASENALPCHERDCYNKILENAKPVGHPDGRHLSAFTYLGLSLYLMEEHNFMEFEQFVKKMHGESFPELECRQEDGTQTLDLTRLFKRVCKDIYSRLGMLLRR